MYKDQYVEIPTLTAALWEILSLCIFVLIYACSLPKKAEMKDWFYFLGNPTKPNVKMTQ